MVPTRNPWLEAARAFVAARGVNPMENVFRREGAFWTITYQGRTCRFGDSKGLRYVAQLVTSPDRGFHVLDLVGDGTASSVERARWSATKAIRTFVKKVARSHPALARHLDNAIKTGVVCRDSPESPVKWS